MRTDLQWSYLQNWAGWWLVKGGELSDTLAYGPFYNEFELTCAAGVHDVPLPAGVLAELRRAQSTPQPADPSAPTS
jgi:hypothetical protein